MSRRLLTAAAILIFSAGVGACKKDEKAGAETKATQPAAGEKVVVTAEGTKFDPPLTTDQIPDGAWMCDMGSVHFAASEKGAEGTCPICGMPLTQKGAKPAPAPKPTPAATGDAGANAKPATATDGGAAAEGAASDHAGHTH